MKNSPRISKLLVAISIFGLWAFLRFFLMMQIRRLIFQSFDFENGEKILINHGMIVVEAFVMFLFFKLLQKFKQIDKINIFSSWKMTVNYGLVYGLFIFAITIPVAFYFNMKYSPQFSAIDAFGNIFSNGAEEFIYRGLLFATVMLIFQKSWIGILISSLAFGAAHSDLPFLFQVYVVLVGAILGWVYLRTKSLACSYFAHMLADLLLDSLFH